MTDPRLLVAHIAIALDSHVTAVRRDGRTAPPEVGQLAVWLTSLLRDRQVSADVALDAARNDAAPVPELLSRHGVARSLGVSVSTVDRLIARGELPSVELAGVRVRRADLARFVEGLPERTPGASKGTAAAPVNGAAAARRAAAASIDPAGSDSLPIVATS